MKKARFDEIDFEELQAKYPREVRNICFYRMFKTTLFSVGLGAWGPMFKQLIRMGIRRSHLFDHDVVETKNLLSQSYTVIDIGQKKSEAMKRILKNVAFEKGNKGIPPLKIYTYGDFLSVSDDEIERLIENERKQGQDVIFILATDYHPAEARANRIAIKFRVPAFWVSLYRKGMAGEIIFYISDYGLPCYRDITEMRYNYFDNINLAKHLNDDFSGSGMSMGLPMAATFVDSILCHLIIGYIHRDIEENQHGRLFRRLLREKRNFIQCQLDPEYRLKGEDLFAQVKGPDVVTFNTIFQIERKKEDCLDCNEFSTGRVWQHTDYTRENYREILYKYSKLKRTEGGEPNYRHFLLDRYADHFDTWDKIQGLRADG